MSLEPFTPLLPTYIDSTMLATGRACWQKFYLEFVRGLRPTLKSIDLHAGGCFALALETIYREFNAGTALDSAVAKANFLFHKSWPDSVIPPKGNQKTRGRMWDAVEAYLREWPPITDHVQPYFIEGQATYECTFSIPLDLATTGLDFPLHPESGEPWRYVGKFDMLGQLSSGRPCIRDEKTTKSFAYNWEDQWDLRSQFIGYVWACQKLGISLDTVVVRGICILLSEIKFKEAVKQYSPYVVQLWLHQLYRDVHRINAMWSQGFFDYNLGDACTSYGGCLYKLMCSSSQPESWLLNFREDRWDPLNRHIEEG